MTLVCGFDKIEQSTAGWFWFVCEPNLEADYQNWCEEHLNGRCFIADTVTGFYALIETHEDAALFRLRFHNDIAHTWISSGT